MLKYYVMIKISFIILLLAVAFTAKAQEGFVVEVNVGIPIGDYRELYNFSLQGNIYYLWETSKNFNIGLTTGALVFLGDASEDWCDGCLFDDYEPELYIPLALASRANLSKGFSIGLDIGYAFYVHLDGGGGLYLRPVITYSLKENLALIISYTNISEDGYSASAINLGVNIRF